MKSPIALAIEVLEPFAAMPVPLMPKGNSGSYWVRWSDIVRARTALAELKAGGADYPADMPEPQG